MCFLDNYFNNRIEGILLFFIKLNSEFEESDVNKMLKGILEKLFKPTPQSVPPKAEQISPAEIEALIEAKLKEHAAAIHPETDADQIEKQLANQEDFKLTAKQMEYALALIDKISSEFELAIAPAELTLKDLNRLIGYQKYKNKGILVNLVKKGILKRKLIGVK